MDDRINHTVKIGWKCAQRRPLRALAHTLLLYDPDYVFLGDDDTYVNYPLLASFTKKRYNPDLYNKLITYGSLCSNVLTPRGYYLGGGGYLFGRKVIEALVSHQILKDFSPIPSNQSNMLSLYHTVLRQERKYNISSLYYKPHSSEEDPNKYHNTTEDYDSYRSNTGVDNYFSSTLLSYLLSTSTANAFSSHATCFLASNTTNTDLIRHSNNQMSKSLNRQNLLTLDSDLNRSTMNIIRQNLKVLRTLYLFREREKVEEEYLSARFHGVEDNIAHLNPNIRAVDLCVLLLSGENTCHHSDHAVTRCLSYGIGAFLRGEIQKCQCYSKEFVHSLLDLLFKNENSPSDEIRKKEYRIRLVAFLSQFPQMCFSNKDCDLGLHLTCHRYRPVSLLNPIPHRFRNL